MENIALSNKTRIPQLGLGTYLLTGSTCYTAVKEALELGYRHIDTAEFYGNEEEIGKAIKPMDRKKLFITSKVWRDHLRYEDVLKAFEGSVKRLGVDYLDLYLIHWPNINIPLKETLDAMKYLYEKKKIRAIGVSNFPLERVKEALKIYPIVMNQVEFHVFLYQKELLNYCLFNNVRITAYAPLARGLAHKEPLLVGIGKKYRKTGGQIALRWLIQKGIIVIPKASTKEHLIENFAVFDFGLTIEEIAQIDNLPQKRLVKPGFAEF